MSMLALRGLMHHLVMMLLGLFRDPGVAHCMVEAQPSAIAGAESAPVGAMAAVQLLHVGLTGTPGSLVSKSGGHEIGSMRHASE
jgi:hypothetical protein